MTALLFAKALPYLLGLGTLVGGYFMVTRNAAKQENARIENLDLRKRAEDEHKMAAVPRVNSDADMVKRMRDGSF